MDWRTGAILAAIVALEGVRRLPPHPLVLRRPLLGTWAVGDEGVRRGPWQLVSWFPPLWTTIVLATSGAAAQAHDVTTRLARARPWRFALDVLGGAVLAALVVGIPLAVARATAASVVLSIGLVAVLAIATTTVSALARKRLGLPRSPAFAALSPFAAPYAAERLLEHALAPQSPLEVAQALLPPERFRSWIRPRVYDAAARGTPPDEELLAVVGRDARAAILAAPARPADATCYCPRCGAVYRQGDTCADCEGIQLERYEGA